MSLNDKGNNFFYLTTNESPNAFSGPESGLTDFQRGVENATIRIAQRMGFIKQPDVQIGADIVLNKEGMVLAPFQYESGIMLMAYCLARPGFRGGISMLDVLSSVPSDRPWGPQNTSFASQTVRILGHEDSAHIRSIAEQIRYDQFVDMHTVLDLTGSIFQPSILSVPNMSARTAQVVYMYGYNPGKDG